MTKPFKLERKIKPERFNAFFRKMYGPDWRRVGRYTTVERAIQGYEAMMNSAWNRDFDYRVETPVGFITLPVVKA